MTMVTDPLFYVLAIPAIIALGLGKGGFAGVGMISTPLLALSVPPLQAAAILLPILLIQDAISVWVYRSNWSTWNLKVLLPGAVLGVAAAWLFAAHVPHGYVELVVGITGVTSCCMRFSPICRPSRNGRARHPACSGARLPALPRPSSKSAPRPIRCICCRSGSISSR